MDPSVYDIDNQELSEDDQAAAYLQEPPLEALAFVGGDQGVQEGDGDSDDDLVLFSSLVRHDGACASSAWRHLTSRLALRWPTESSQPLAASAGPPTGRKSSRRPVLRVAAL